MTTPSSPPATLPTRRRRDEGQSGHGVRADIQGLRAIAVTSVVVFHFWPSLLPGGFTGVDVFFVVSGFLITGRILRDLESGRSPGSFVAHFWAARVRRILPAALLVLALVMVATWFLLPESRWAEVGQHVFASALSIENWQLAREAVDYGAEGAAVSPVQHFWSLSVEEQFYLGWPLLLLGASMLAVRFGSRIRVSRTTVLALVMGSVLVASLAYSFSITWSNSGAAYFVTPARIWQLAAGGLLALLAQRGSRFLPWVGVAMIAVAFFVVDTDTPYPGFAALLPTIGTGLVLLGGTEGRLTFDRLVRPRPIQWLGDVSYSLYLWHWPLIVLVPIGVGRDLDALEKVGLLGVALLLSQASYVLVEQPFRTGWLLRAPARSWVLGATAIAIILGGATRVEAVGEARVQSAAQAFAELARNGGACFGAAALDDDRCTTPYAPIPRSAALAASTDLPKSSRKPRCSDDTGRFSTVVCRFGDPQGTKTILLWGNSHASAWSDAVDAAGKLLGYRVIVAARAACPAALGDRPSDDGLRDVTAEEAIGCARRTEWVVKTLVPQADIVLMADLRSGFVGPGHDISPFVRAIDAVRAAGSRVIWMADVPLTATVDTRRDAPDCLVERGQCTNSLTRALAALEVTRKVQERVPDLDVIETRDRFCTDVCYAAIGGISVYFDASHLTGSYSRSLGPWLAREIQACLEGSNACRPRL